VLEINGIEPRYLVVPMCAPSLFPRSSRLVTAGWLFLLLAELAQGGLGTDDMTMEHMTIRRLLDEDAPLIAVILETPLIP